MNFTNDKKYFRIEAVVYVEMEKNEKMEEAENRFLCALPNGMDCVRLKLWVLDEEE